MTHHTIQNRREKFLAIARINVSMIGQQMEILQTAGFDTTIQSIYTNVHSLKVESQKMGFGIVAGLANVLENFLTEVRQGRIAKGSDMICSFHKAIKLLEKIIDDLMIPQTGKLRKNRRHSIQLKMNY